MIIMWSSIRIPNFDVSPSWMRSRNLVEFSCSSCYCFRVLLFANKTFLDAFALFRYVMIHLAFDLSFFIFIFILIEKVVFLEMLVVRFLGYCSSHCVQTMRFAILCHYREFVHHLFPSVLNHSVCNRILLMVLFYFDQSLIKQFIFFSEPPSISSMSFFDLEIELPSRLHFLHTKLASNLLQLLVSIMLAILRKTRQNISLGFQLIPQVCIRSNKWNQ